MKLYKIKKSNIDKRGLCASKNISAGSRIIEYVGKIISNKEVDKNPASYAQDDTGGARGGLQLNRFDRPTEGDPDFLSDCSRIYVSMRTSVDENFGIPVENLYAAHRGTLENKTGPAIVLKSDEIRIIARKDEERSDNDSPINGSIRIIKEGTLGDDQCSIYLLPEGVVQISGTRVYIGLPNAGGGQAAGSSEPWIKYSALQRHLTDLYSMLTAFCGGLNSHVTPGHGVPSTEINQAASVLSNALSGHEAMIPTLCSTRIFGE